MAVTSPMAFPQLAERLRTEIDAELASYAEFDSGCPQQLADAIRYSLLAPGKRLRPILVLLAAEACGSTYGEAMPAACAVEMVHAYSLVHDDLPSMDDDDLRRGRPTCHRAFDEATAILVGDALLTRAFEIVAAHVQPPVTAVQCCATLARAAGASGMVGGQANDLAAERSDLPDDEEDKLKMLEKVHRGKTAALFVAALRMGGLVARAESRQLEALESYGGKIGLAFQIVDDLLDAMGDESATGKRVQKDETRGKLTYPGLVGLDESRQLAQSTIEEACQLLGPFGSRAVGLETLARYLVERDR